MAASKVGQAGCCECGGPPKGPGPNQCLPNGWVPSSVHLTVDPSYYSGHVGPKYVSSGISWSKLDPNLGQYLTLNHFYNSLTPDGYSMWSGRFITMHFLDLNPYQGDPTADFAYFLTCGADDDGGPPGGINLYSIQGYYYTPTLVENWALGAPGNEVEPLMLSNGTYHGHQFTIS